MKKLNSAFHASLGFLILIIYFYIYINLEDMFPKLADAFSCVGYFEGKKESGLYLFALLPFISVCCFLFPRWLMIRFSPRTKPLGELILTEGFWYFIGYVLIILIIVGLMAFI